MTIKEELDEKVKRDCVVWLREEIRDIFLSIDSKILKKGATINVYYQNPKEIFYKMVDKKDEVDGEKDESGCKKNESGCKKENLAKCFNQQYHSEILKDVISKLRDDRLSVDDNDEKNVFITYRPF